MIVRSTGEHFPVGYLHDTVNGSFCFCFCFFRDQHDADELCGWWLVYSLHQHLVSDR